MILFYVDESGSANWGNKQVDFFVLTSIAITAQDWPRIDNEIFTLKRQLVSWKRPEEWEIKGRDLRQGLGIFQGQSWESRAAIITRLSETLGEFPCQLFAVRFNKRQSEPIASEDLYRQAFHRLLSELQNFLEHANEDGMLLLDSRSTADSAVQDRRVVDSYREWAGLQPNRSRFVDVPWFGFSAFYAGLQLADYVSYLIHIVSNEIERGKHGIELQQAFNRLQNKTRIVTIF